MTTTAQQYDSVKYKTPTGNTLNCKGWIQEAALRMLLNNLDPEVAERPDDLIVYGGRGKAARNFEALDNIIAALKILETDETLLIQSGKPVGPVGHQLAVADEYPWSIFMCLQYTNGLAALY